MLHVETNSNNNNKTQNNIFQTKVISPKVTNSLCSIPDCPKYINITFITKTHNLELLKKLENEYDEFLDTKYQILHLLNIIEEVFEIRDAITMRINYIERELQQNKLVYILQSINKI